MRDFFLTVVICFVTAGCTPTDQPCYTQIPLQQVPQDVLEKIRTGFASATIDRAEEVSAQAGPGCRIFFHDAKRNYWLETSSHE